LAARRLQRRQRGLVSDEIQLPRISSRTVRTRSVTSSTRAVAGSVLTGRRRSQGGKRGDLDIIEVDEAGLIDAVSHTPDRPALAGSRPDNTEGRHKHEQMIGELLEDALERRKEDDKYIDTLKTLKQEMKLQRRQRGLVSDEIQLPRISSRTVRTRSVTSSIRAVAGSSWIREQPAHRLLSAPRRPPKRRCPVSFS
jgi:hypothetical protein